MKKGPSIAVLVPTATVSSKSLAQGDLIASNRYPAPQKYHPPDPGKTKQTLYTYCSTWHSTTIPINGKLMHSTQPPGNSKLRMASSHVLLASAINTTQRPFFYPIVPLAKEKLGQISDLFPNSTPSMSNAHTIPTQETETFNRAG